MMKMIHAVWKNGQIVPTQPVDWPEGTALAVEPIEELLVTDPQGDLLGNDPASIARWLAWFDSLEPLSFTPEEEAAWEAARRERRDWEKSRFDERAERLKGILKPVAAPAFQAMDTQLDALPTLPVLARTVSGCLNSAFLGLF